MADEKRILHLGAQGDGVAEDGAFVPFTLPGERVAATGVLAPAPERVAPLCRHFGTCGGCALQHASDGFVAAWKERLVAAALGARGLKGVAKGAALRPILTVPPGSRRRIALAGRRTKKGVSLGFHAPASDTIVPVEECPVARPRLVATLPALVPLVRAGASRTGVLRLTLTDGLAGVDAAVEGAKAVREAGFLATLAGLAAEAGLARLSWNGEVVAMAAPPEQSFGRARVVPPPGGFLQPTAEGEAALAAAVAEALGPLGKGARVADLFAGSGAFALRLAEGADVLAVEGAAEAVAALEAGWRATPGLHRVVARARDLFERPLEAGELKGLDAVVLDPPRAGARAQCERLAVHGPGRIAYASCNPATFARDARTLVDGGYVLDWVQPVDQFRWSPHVELAAAFYRA